jgi:hypothetical protein
VAKKAKTPPPPRRVQAPKTRTGDDDGRRARMLLYGLAAAGLVALAIVLAVVFTSGSSGGGSGSGVASAMKDAGCTFKTLPASIPKGGDTHVDSLTAPIHWNTFPPSNGQHYPAPAVWDFYSKAVNPRLVVHNLEHGGVILWWGEKTPQAEIDKLSAFYQDSPESMLGTPIDGLGSKIAITAWTGDASRYTQKGYYGEGHIGTCPRWDDKTAKAFEEFRDAYRGKGPEGVPSSQNQPGT